jgi:hypothetical protein
MVEARSCIVSVTCPSVKGMRPNRVESSVVDDPIVVALMLLVGFIDVHEVGMVHFQVSVETACPLPRWDFNPFSSSAQSPWHIGFFLGCVPTDHNRLCMQVGS